MGNPFGRSIVLALTNQSGGSVAAGDFVYLDTAHNDSFTTGTTSAYTGAIGIAQQTIGSGSLGLVLVQGYASLVTVNASVTRGHYGKSYTVVKQATDAGTTRIAGTCLQFLTGGTTPDAILWQPDLGGGSGIVDPGGMAAGAALSSINGSIAWNSGTSFPGSKATGDRYWRTDLGLEAYWDGTRWLSVQEFELTGGLYMPAVGFLSATGDITRYGTTAGDFDMYITKCYVTTFVSGTNNGSNFWTVGVNKFDSAFTGTSLGTASTASDTGSTTTAHSITINAAVVTATYPAMSLSLATKTGGPGSILVMGHVMYRLILT